MAEYKILASDLDGTLLNSYGAVSPENFKAIDEITALGAHFVPASGRTLAEIPKEIRNNPNIRYIIHSSGAVVYDKLTEERISFCFPRKISEAVFKILFASECHVTARHRGEMFTSAETMNEKCLKYYNVWGPHAELLRNVAECIDDFREVFSSADDVEMISGFFHDDAELLRVRALLSDIPEINVASACPHNIELTFVEAGKGNALAALAEKLEIPISQTIAVGDSENDAPMVKAAGLGLAVSNATDSLKAQADEIVCSNDQHVLKYIFDRYF